MSFEKDLAPSGGELFGAAIVNVGRCHKADSRVPVVKIVVLPPLSVGEMTLRLYGALNYSQNNARDLRRAVNGA